MSPEHALDEAEEVVGPQPGESRKERVDRELREVLEEVRVALPGVELLLGFLLILPFSERFAALDDLARAAYLVCFVVTAGSIALFISPTAFHRFGFREIDKERLVMRTNLQVVGGLLLLAVAITLAAFVVAAVVLDRRWAGVIAGGVALWLAVWWFAAPMRERRRRRRSGERRSAGTRIVGGEADVGPRRLEV